MEYVPLLLIFSFYLSILELHIFIEIEDFKVYDMHISQSLPFFFSSFFPLCVWILECWLFWSQVQFVFVTGHRPLFIRF